MSLKEYTRKRDFKKTAEPPAKVGKGSLHSFVIQKHDASRLHYDLRLEMDGTLKSWALPKGLPYAHGEKHLAVQVEDHPVVPRGSKWGQGITASEMRLCHWVEPLMVCQVKFAEWTRDERLRQPVFLGLREDKEATEVVGEKVS